MAIKNEIMAMVQSKSDAQERSWQSPDLNIMPNDAIGPLRWIKLEEFAELVQTVCEKGKLDLCAGLRHVLQPEMRANVGNAFPFIGDALDHLAEVSRVGK